jgi:ferredoxin-NADP reductase
MRILKIIDKQLNGITMYRLLVYGLSALLALSILFALIGQLPISAFAIALSSAVILTVGLIADRTLPVIFKATSNNQSSLITSLILCCILPPSTSIHDLALLGLGTLIALISKYVVTIHYKHLFNPAAFAAIVLGLANLLPATWWVGSPILLPATVIFGLLVLRKIRRFQLFISFLVASLAVGIILGLVHDESIRYVLSTAFRSSPLIFLGTIMLTEPSTTPPRVWQQRIYGALVGALFMSQLRVGSVTATPELALIAGNIYSYGVSPKYKLKLAFKRMQQLAPGIYDFSFSGAQRLAFRPGQYLEWTLPDVKTDSRGNRRTFSIASAPGEDEVHLAFKAANPSSNFKTALLALEPGELMMAGQLAGDFVLPNNLDQKLVFVAGGIGITPFVSMAKALIKTKQKRDIVLLYFIPEPKEYCYSDLWIEAAAYGLRVVPIVTNKEITDPWKGLVGRLTKEMLEAQTADYKERRFYISGPSGLVENYTRLLKGLGLKQSQIVTDHFSGY